MAFDTTGLTDWPVPDTLETTAEDLLTKATSFRKGVDDCEREWKSITDHFHTDNGTTMGRIEDYFQVIIAHGDVVEGTASKVKDHIGTFAADIRDLESRRTTAYSRIERHGELSADGDEPENGIYSETHVQDFINTIVADLVLAAEDCSARLEGIDVQSVIDDGWLPNPSANDAVGVGALTEYERVTFDYDVLERHQFPVWDYTTTAPSADWIADADGNITRAPFVSGWEHTGYRYETRTVTHRGVRTEWATMKTPVNNWAYENIPRYRDKVDLRPDLYTTDGPRFWDAKGRLVDFQEALAHGNNWTRALRVAGPIATVVTAGLTYNSEYQKALEEVAAEHPDWSQEEIEARAREMRNVQGTTQLGLDFGYGAAGATIGTFIGGPIGTVVGFGAGFVIGWAAEELGLNDVIKDGVQSAWDWGSDVAGDVGDAVGDAWNSIFG
ncbi:MAG: hypothetical protein ACTH3G_12300 [Citricoccus sp.]